MNTATKVVIILVVAAATVGVVVGKRLAATGSEKDTTVSQPAEATGTPQTAGPRPPSRGLPRLLDLGSKSCIPCKQMAPILEELKSEYEGRCDVEFIDIYENPDAADEHGIMLIPTQIFFDEDGRELFRHEGFYGKEDILAKWEELGVALTQ